jgi:lysophospholipase L1-like esterase
LPIFYILRYPHRATRQASLVVRVSRLNNRVPGVEALETRDCPSVASVQPAPSPPARLAVLDESPGSGPAMARLNTIIAQAKPRLGVDGRINKAWLANHNALVRRSYRGDASVLFLGDSITKGWLDGGRSVWDRYFRPMKAVPFGIAGDRTQNVLWRIQHGELAGIRPRVVVLLVGTNNLDSSTPPEIAHGIATVVHAIRKRLPTSRVLLLGILPREHSPSRYLRGDIREVNRLIAHLGDGDGIRYRNIGRHFLDRRGYLSKAIMPDYLHPNLLGYRIFADAIHPTLRAMMQLPRLK